MKTDPAKLRAWRERSRPLAAKKPMPARRSFMPRRNEKRLRKRRVLEFGEQADLCRYMPCPVCHPSYWRSTGLALIVDDARRHRAHGEEARVSDPHHTVTRGSGRGRDEHTAPLCRAHHRELDAPNSGPKTFEKRHGVDLRAIAAAIYNAISKERAA